jgi:hypothetical protein
MLNKLALIFCLLLSFKSQAQWVSKTVNNGIDEPYRIAYCRSSDETASLKLEKVDSSVAFYLSGGYHCDGYSSVDIGLTIGSETKRYSFETWTSSDKRTVFILDDIRSVENVEFLKDFQRSTKLSIRINESHCENDYYSFIMTGSTRALNFISK